MADYRVHVGRDPDPEAPAERPWRVRLVTPPGEVLGDVHVGWYPTMHEAVTRGVTAARFAAVGIPVEAAR